MYFEVTRAFNGLVSKFVITKQGVSDLNLRRHLFLCRSQIFLPGLWMLFLSIEVRLVVPIPNTLPRDTLLWDKVELCNIVI